MRVGVSFLTRTHPLRTDSPQQHPAPIWLSKSPENFTPSMSMFFCSAKKMKFSYYLCFFFFGFGSPLAPPCVLCSVQFFAPKEVLCSSFGPWRKQSVSLCGWERTLFDHVVSVGCFMMKQVMMMMIRESIFSFHQWARALFENMM